jgi:hypothetical protein
VSADDVIFRDGKRQKKAVSEIFARGELGHWTGCKDKGVTIINYRSRLGDSFEFEWVGEGSSGC